MGQLIAVSLYRKVATLDPAELSHAGNDQDLTTTGVTTMASEVPRGPNGKRRYAMDYIPDAALYAAVMFARNLIREGTPPGVAITRAANYYEVEVSDVARYVGQAGGTCSHRKKRRP